MKRKGIKEYNFYFYTYDIVRIVKLSIYEVFS